MSVGLACGIVFGLIFIAAPFTTSIRPQIYRASCLWLSARFVLWGASGLLSSARSLSSGTRYFLRFIEPRFGASGFGVILLLAYRVICFVALLGPSVIPAKSSNQSMQPTTLCVAFHI